MTEEVIGETITGSGAGDGVEAKTPFYCKSVPQASQQLWTPHRMTYIGEQNKPSDDTPVRYPFCTGPQRSDEEVLIVHRGQTSYVIIDLYPYNTGHLLVCSYQHVSDWTEVTTAKRQEIGKLITTVISVVRLVSRPHGFNLGISQDEIAGAGIAAHLHQHIVPHWKGGADFMPIIDRAKPIPQLLGEQRDIFAAVWVASVGQNGD